MTIRAAAEDYVVTIRATAQAHEANNDLRIPQTQMQILAESFPTQLSNDGTELRLHAFVNNIIFRPQHRPESLALVWESSRPRASPR